MRSVAIRQAGARTGVTTNVHLYASPFTHETRILKETATLARSRVFDRIVIGAMWEAGLQELERLDEVREVWRVRSSDALRRLGLPGKALRFAAWGLGIFWRLRRDRVAAVNCHSWAMLPFGVLFKLAKGARLVYDTHELETETGAGRLQRWASKAVEATLIRYADAIIVVNQSIGEWYRARYARPGAAEITVVRNIPDRTHAAPAATTLLRDLLRLRESDFLCIYQGLLDEGRNIEMLLRVFARAQPERHIVFLGFGGLEPLVVQYATAHSNIHFHPSVPPAEVMRYTGSADIGVHVLGNTCLNHYLCLPNKVFEYLMSGLPQIASDFPEIAHVIRENDCGWTTAPEEDAVLRLVNGLTREEVLAKKANALRNRDRYAWQHEEPALLAAYRAVVGAETK